jgi:hypothetical protein
MAGFLQMCLQVPNLGSLVFFIIFVLAIPGFLISSGQYSVFNYYFPLLTMLASVLTESGKPRYFQELYPAVPDSLSGFLSKNIINLLAITAIFISVISMSMESNNLILGLAAGLLSVTLIFPIAGTVIPFFIRQFDYLLKDNTKFKYPGNWHKYFVGFVFIILFMIIQNLLMRVITQTALSTKLTNNVAKNNLVY